MSTRIPRIYTYPIFSYSYLLPIPSPFPGANPRPGLVPVGLPLRSGDRLLLGGGPGYQSMRGSVREIFEDVLAIFLLLVEGVGFFAKGIGFILS